MPTEHDNDEKTRRLWRFRYIALAVSTLLSLGLLSFVVRRKSNEPIYLQEPGYERTGHRYLYDAQLGWRNIPNWQATTNGRKLTINSRGLRDREYPYEKPPGVRRILVLGDSFAWGYGVGDEEIFTEVLERRLNKDRASGRAFEVINTGVSGWGTDQEYLFLREEGFQYQPDIVLLAFFLVNDIQNNASSQVYGMQKPVFLDESLELANVPVPRPSVKSSVIRARIDPLDLTLAIIRRMRDDCRQRNCRLVVVKFGRYLPQWKENAELLKNDRAFKDGIQRRLQLPYLDLDDQFDAHMATADELLRGNDDGHWNAYGHKLAAEIQLKFLRDSGLLNPRLEPGNRD